MDIPALISPYAQPAFLAGLLGQAVSSNISSSTWHEPNGDVISYNSATHSISDTDSNGTVTLFGNGSIDVSLPGDDILFSNGNAYISAGGNTYTTSLTDPMLGCDLAQEFGSGASVFSSTLAGLFGVNGGLSDPTLDSDIGGLLSNVLSTLEKAPSISNWGNIAADWGQLFNQAPASSGDPYMAQILVDLSNMSQAHDPLTASLDYAQLANDITNALNNDGSHLSTAQSSELRDILNQGDTPYTMPANPPGAPSHGPVDLAKLGPLWGDLWANDQANGQENDPVLGSVLNLLNQLTYDTNNGAPGTQIAQDVLALSTAIGTALSADPTLTTSEVNDLQSVLSVIGEQPYTGTIADQIVGCVFASTAAGQLFDAPGGVASTLEQFNSPSLNQDIANLNRDVVGSPSWTSDYGNFLSDLQHAYIAASVNGNLTSSEQMAFVNAVGELPGILPINAPAAAGPTGSITVQTKNAGLQPGQGYSYGDGNTADFLANSAAIFNLQESPTQELTLGIEPDGSADLIAYSLNAAGMWVSIYSSALNFDPLTDPNALQDLASTMGVLAPHSTEYADLSTFLGQLHTNDTPPTLFSQTTPGQAFANTWGSLLSSGGYSPDVSRLENDTYGTAQWKADAEKVVGDAASLQANGQISLSQLDAIQNSLGLT